MAAAIVGVKLGIPVAHVEAGLRSHDRTMPEEINRIVTDRLASVHFTPSTDGDENLRREGTAPASIHRVGNVMIDSLVKLLPLADGTPLLRKFGLMNGVGPKPFVLATLHRPSNVDDPAMLRQLVEAFAAVAAQVPVVFPVHPRTRQRLDASAAAMRNVTLTDPLSYLEFLGLQQHATVVVTDSGGIQEETTFLGVPCLTLRQNTERPVTVTEGTNILVGRDTVRMQAEIAAALDGRGKEGRVPELWDGRAAERVAHCLSHLGVLA
jgi:UDP-N-acetylglucosamine 2-epimerase (non-hydrolysing)